MANFLRQIVAGPRARHPEADLDLCYVTDHIIATSGPSQTYPQRAYRNPLDRVVSFLDERHGEDWAIWEFRAEGTGYPDHLVYDRVRHYPWPDHHPPPFRLIPMIMASMRNWLHGNDLAGDETGDHMNKTGERRSSFKNEGQMRQERNEKRVVVVHCKAGKGRSGTVSCSYLISEEGWTPEDALARFTQRRMRPRFGAGVSIPSQLRTISYVDRWTKGGKKYFDRPIEILEIHVWGLRDGVKVDIAGFADEGKRIEVLHTFRREERHVVEGDAPDGGGLADMVWQMAGYSANPKREAPPEAPLADSANLDESDPKKSHSLKQRGTKLIHKAASTSSLKGKDKDHENSSGSDEKEPGGKAVILRPTQPVRIANSDVQVSVERRNKTSKSMGFTMVSAVAHVWFNTFFEGNGPEQDGKADDNGIFTIEWDALDGIKGSSRKGARALDRMSVVWRAAEGNGEQGSEVDEPSEGQPVPQLRAADWQGGHEYEKELGLRVQSPASADVSKASSILDDPRSGGGSSGAAADDIDEWEGMRTSGPTGEELDRAEKKEKKKD